MGKKPILYKRNNKSSTVYEKELNIRKHPGNVNSSQGEIYHLTPIIRTTTQKLKYNNWLKLSKKKIDLIYCWQECKLPGARTKSGQNILFIGT